MIHQRTLAQVEFKRMQKYQYFLARLRFEYNCSTKSPFVQNTLKHIKIHRETWRAATSNEVD